MLPRLLFLTASILIVAGSSIGRAGQDTDPDPKLDGKKGSEWVRTLIDDPSARKRALAVDALAKLWAQKRYAESLPSISRSLRLDSSTAVRARPRSCLGG